MRPATKTDHELTVERLLQQVVSRLDKLNAALMKNFGSLSPSMTIDEEAPAALSPSRSTGRQKRITAPQAPIKPTGTSYTIPAPRTTRGVKQASVAPLSPTVAKALKGPQFDFVPWFINEFCPDNRGRTITCRAVSEVSALHFGRHPATEIALAVVAKHFPDTFKIVKTSIYEDATFAGNEIIIQPADNPTNKRLSAVRIF